MPLEVRPLTLSADALAALGHRVQEDLSAALDTHASREELYAKRLREYKGYPETAQKMFPWANASNVVVPLVAITVDALVARLHKALMASKDFAEISIRHPAWEGMEADLREWVNWHVRSSGARDRLRTAFFDCVLNGDAYVKPLWEDETRKYHAYDAAGEVVEQEIPTYSGVRWHIIAPEDFIAPIGYDSLDQLPWFAQRLRYTWAELLKAEKDGLYEDVERLRAYKTERADPRFKEAMRAAGTQGTGPVMYTLYEVQGLWEIEEDRFEEVILTYSLEAGIFVRTIYNPFFGRSRHLTKIPFLVQAHEFYAMGAAEQVAPFQYEASTAHNQVIDSATAANAGLVVCSPEANFGNNEEIYPGKRIVTEKPAQDVVVMHLSEPSPTLGSMERQAAYLAEKRSGVSSYNMGLESTVVGSQATATGTTATIAEGNIRFWLSIDDLRHAIEELLYLTLQQIQQFAPEGYPFEGRILKLPPGDPRTSIGLKIVLTNETVNQMTELQNLQILMGVLDNYYMKLNQLMAVLLNPGFPAPMKMVAMAVMEASTNIVKRFVERFELENIDQIVPNLQSIFGGMQNGGQAQPPPGPSPAGLGGIPGPPPAPSTGPPPGLGPGAGISPMPGGM
jgi:hypothetical protein